MSLLERLGTAGFVIPDYEGGSLVNLASSILDAFGALRPDDPPPARDLDAALLRDARAVVLVLVDGLGELQLRSLAARGIVRRLASVERGTLTSVFPSTTVAALASLDTARSPATHGLVGYTIWLEEFGTVGQMLRWGPAHTRLTFADPPYGREPRGFVPLETFDRRLAGAGVAHFLVHPAIYRTSALVRMLAPEATYVPYFSTSTAAVLARELLRTRPWGAGRAFISIYWPTLDTVAHAHGTRGAEHDAEARAIDQLLVGPLLEAAAGDVAFVLTADHGHSELDPAATVHFEQHPELLALLRYPPTGEPRAAFLAPRDGDAVAVRDYCREIFPDALSIDVDEALAAGLYGSPVAPMTRSRAGELLLAATGTRQYRYAFSADGLPVHRGSHGGLAPAEMLVPLLVWRR